MARAKKPGPPDKKGAKSKYQNIDLERVELLAAGGLTKLEIAKSFGVSIDSVMEYQKAYPEFSEAIAKGRARLAEDIEMSMKKLAMGFAIPEEKVFYDSKRGIPIRVETVKVFPPDVKAQHILLQRAESGTWNPKQEHRVELNEIVRYHKPDRKKL